MSKSLTPRLTQSAARNMLPGSVTFTCRDGEYRLAYSMSAMKTVAGLGDWTPRNEIVSIIESSAYYTCDLSDLMQTADRMHLDYVAAYNQLSR